MDEEEKKAIKEINNILKYWQTIVDIEDDVLREIEMSLYCEEMPFNQMKILLNALDKKDKVINLMAEDRAEISEPKVSKEAIIDFYYKKVEKENELK